jgi:drug/metabolite transporter (DMT)-like permease
MPESEGETLAPDHRHFLAALAAVAFGVTTPIVAFAGQDVGPLSTAALLYVGAALTALVMELTARRRETSIRRSDVVRLVAIALAGGAIAPSLLAWGLQRAGATTGAQHDHEHAPDVHHVHSH